MTAKEQKTENWNRKLENLKTLTFCIGGYRGFEFTIIEGTNVIVGEKYPMVKAVKNAAKLRLPYSREELLAELRAWHLDRWKPNYENPGILDGTSWQLTLEFQNNSEPVEFSGCNAYPRQFKRVEGFFADLRKRNPSKADTEEDAAAELAKEKQKTSGSGPVILYPENYLDVNEMIRDWTGGWEEPQDDTENWELLCYPVQVEHTALLVFRSRQKLYEHRKGHHRKAHTVDKYRVLEINLWEDFDDCHYIKGRYQFTRKDTEVATVYQYHGKLFSVERGIYEEDYYSVQVWPKGSHEKMPLFKNLHRFAAKSDGTLCCGYDRNQLTNSKKLIVAIDSDGYAHSCASQVSLRCADLTLDCKEDLWFHLHPSSAISQIHNEEKITYPVEINGFDGFCLTEDNKKLIVSFTDSPVETALALMEYEDGAFLNPRQVILDYGTEEAPNPNNCFVLNHCSMLQNYIISNWNNVLYFYDINQLCRGEENENGGKDEANGENDIENDNEDNSRYS